MTAAPTRRVVAALSARGQTVRFVGGCVRDAILGRRIKDIDLATPDDPNTVTDLLNAGGIATIPTGIAHGTVTAVANDRHFEITSLRRDIETDGRHARVEFTDDWTADAKRRDFTINALYCDPDGAVYDPVEGRADLANGRIRFVGIPEERIREDFLRILRFFRFFAWYGRTAPDRAAFEACALLAPGMSALAGERIATELLRLLGAPEPATVFALMVQRNILDAVTPALRNIDRLRSLCAFEDAAGLADPLRRISALFAGADDSMAATCDRLHLSAQQRGRLTRNLEAPGRLTINPDKRSARAALYELGPEAFSDLLLLAFADGGDIGRDAESARDLLAYAASWPIPSLPISGQDLLDLGFQEGPEFGEQLRALERLWVDDDFAPDRTALLALAKG